MVPEERKKWVHFSRHLLYIWVFVLIYVIQNTPALFSIGGVKPVLLLPAAIAFAMFEGEFTGGLYGAFAGLLCDVAGGFLFGFDAILTLVGCTAAGLLTIYLLRRKLVSAMILSFAFMALRCLLRFSLEYGIWGYEGIELIFWKETLWKTLYSTVFTPLFYYMWKQLCGYFAAKLEE